jgi:hypothetical protein
MPGKRPNHIFKHVDLGDVGAVRRLMSALAYYLSRRVLHPHAPEILALRGPEKTAADSILCSVRNHRALYPLLLEGVLRFIDVRNEDGREVLQAAKDLDGLARAEVLAFPGDYYEEYVEAEIAFYGNDGMKIDPQKTQVLVDTVSLDLIIVIQELRPQTRLKEKGIILASQANLCTFRHRGRSASKSSPLSPIHEPSRKG